MSSASPSTQKDQDDPVHSVALSLLEGSEGLGAEALAQELSRKHAAMASEIGDLRQRLFEKTCELAEVKSLKNAPEPHSVAPEQIAEWFKHGDGKTGLPISEHAELLNFRALAPSYLIRLAKSSKLGQVPWKDVMRKTPWKTGVWRALKRYQRRTR